MSWAAVALPAVAPSDSDDAVDHLVDWSAWAWVFFLSLAIVFLIGAVAFASAMLAAGHAAVKDDADTWAVTIGAAVVSLVLSVGYGLTAYEVLMRCTSWARSWLAVLLMAGVAIATAVAAMGRLAPDFSRATAWPSALAVGISIIIGVTDSLRRMAASIPMGLGAFITTIVVLLAAGGLIAASNRGRV